MANLTRAFAKKGTDQMGCPCLVCADCSGALIFDRGCFNVLETSRVPTWAMICTGCRKRGMVVA